MLSNYRNKLEQYKGQKIQIENQIKNLTNDITYLIRNRGDTEKAQIVIRTVAQATQQELEYHISDIVSLALSAVFDDPYELKLDFVIRRGKTEADINFSRNGELVKPMYASGGGAVDIASFALRVALWSLSQPKTRNTLILDEPTRNLSLDLQSKAGEMLKQISEKLNLQIIMISHVPDLIESADKVFNVELKKGVSKII